LTRADVNGNIGWRDTAAAAQKTMARRNPQADTARTLGESATRRRRAVMTDVAKLAGVSHQTVSRVINGSESVRGETRDRVLAAMHLLDYRPNSAARALATGHSKTIGVVTFDTTLYGPASTLFGIERAAHASGYFVSVVSLLELDRAALHVAVESLRSQGVEGILVIATDRQVGLAMLQLPQDVPVVAVEGPGEGMPLVAVDQFAGAVLATRHLLELGHRTVAHIAGPEYWLEAQQRVAGWRSALEEAGARIPPPVAGDWSARSGYELGHVVCADPTITAVFVANDPMALGLLRCLHEAGRQIPHSISVVGFDDVPEAAFFSPPLTTVRQDFLQVGRSSFDLLLEEIERGSRSSARVTVPPELVVRASTAPPAT
jgi:DNA-binding LacI/PurR family transcriptional regulator